MKVLLVTNYKSGRGGISGQVELLSKHLSEEGVETDVFSTNGNVFHRIVLYFKLRMVARKYDVIHAHGCSGIGMVPIIFSVKIGKRFHKKVVATYHGGSADVFFSKYTRLVKRYLTRTDTNIVLSGFLAKVFDKYNIPYVIIPNIVELDAGAFRKRTVVYPNFISVRTLSPLYNIECIIKAFAVAKRSLPDARLTIVGDGPSRTELEKMVVDLRLKDVVFTGRVPNSQIYSYLNEADIMLSSPKIDNMPVSLLEAFNAGLLVISSKVGGVPYMIDDGENGLLFESNNYEMLAQKMVESVNQSEATLAMMNNAKECVKRYSWDKVKLKLYETYEYEPV